MSCEYAQNLQKFAAMRTPYLFLVPALLTLAACTPMHTSIDQQNQNPLTASRYGDELADTMANFIITNDPIVKDAAIRKVIDAEIARGKDIATSAREIQSDGLLGSIIGIKADVIGLALLSENVLYLSSDFITDPGASLHVYVTTVVDPRDDTFPDATAIDLGSLQATYGPQQYDVPVQDDPNKLRTFVLYDTKLKIIYGFAQISKSA